MQTICINIGPVTSFFASLIFRHPLIKTQTSFSILHTLWMSFVSAEVRAARRHVRKGRNGYRVAAASCSRRTARSQYRWEWALCARFSSAAVEPVELIPGPAAAADTWRAAPSMWAATRITACRSSWALARSPLLMRVYLLYLQSFNPLPNLVFALKWNLNQTCSDYWTLWWCLLIWHLRYGFWWRWTTIYLCTRRKWRNGQWWRLC